MVLTFDPGFVASLWRLSLAIWSSVTLVGGLALLGAWRASGRARPARLGPALMITALLTSLVPIAFPVTSGSDDHFVARSVVLMAILSVAGVQIVRAIRAPEVEAGLRPLRELPLLIAVAAGLAAAFVALLPVVDGAGAALIHGLPPTVCLLAALAVAGVGKGRPRSAVLAVATAMLLLAVAFYARVDLTSTPLVLAASVSFAGSAGLLGAIAAQSLRSSLLRHEYRSMRTMTALADYQTAVHRDRERRHDALSALAAIRSASEVLTSNGAALRQELRQDLVMAVRAELSRVERMLAPEQSRGPIDIDLRQALDAVVLAWRQQGMQIRGLARGVLVNADPDVVARIVNNLLHNAHRYAPGAEVRLVVDQTEDAVHLSVVDTGRGVPRQRRPEIFTSGASWGEHGGQGLGLASAKRLADEQGGELRLLDVDDGCWFVLTLPRAGALAANRRRGQDR